MHEGFLAADADTLPFGWIPSHLFPSADLANAWSHLHRCCGDDGAEQTSEAKKMAKKLILATIGLWGKHRTTTTCRAP